MVCITRENIQRYHSSSSETNNKEVRIGCFFSYLTSFNKEVYMTKSAKKEMLKKMVKSKGKGMEGKHKEMMDSEKGEKYSFLKKFAKK